MNTVKLAAPIPDERDGVVLPTSRRVASLESTGREYVTWTALSFNTGWADLTPSTIENCAWRQLDDIIYLKGVPARSTGTSLVIGTLPTGARPGKYVYFVTFAQSSTGVFTFDRIRVDPNNGQIDLLGINSLTNGQNFCYLDGIFFSLVST